jgi:hypothetical protein
MAGSFFAKADVFPFSMAKLRRGRPKKPRRELFASRRRREAKYAGQKAEKWMF